MEVEKGGRGITLGGWTLGVTMATNMMDPLQEKGRFKDKIPKSNEIELEFFILRGDSC